MPRKTSHWREVDKAPQLQLMRTILMEASGPMTQGDIRRELDRRGQPDAIEAIPTVIWEIGQNTCHSTSGGVRFPDGKWRYWLIAAPGWTPRWIVTKDFKIVPAGTEQVILTSEDAEEKQGEEVRDVSQPPTVPPSDVTLTPRLCLSCDRPAVSGSLFCANDACEEKYWDKLTGKKEG